MLLYKWLVRHAHKSTSHYKSYLRRECPGLQADRVWLSGPRAIAVLETLIIVFLPSQPLIRLMRAATSQHAHRHVLCLT
jgi:hypothetical protein